MQFRLLAKYSVVQVIGLLAASVWYSYNYFPSPIPTSSGSQGVIGRAQWYGSHAAEFNVIFLGDSRTYCGIHPFLVDPLLKTNSFNLAQFAHWLPTQYSMIKELAPRIPPTTTVIWTIGHQNFFVSSGIQRVYPIGLANAFRFIAWNVPTQGLMDNLLFYNPLSYLMAVRGEARQRIINALDAPFEVGHLSFISSAHAEDLSSTSIPRACPSETDVMCAEKSWRDDGRIAEFSTTNEDGRQTSMVFYTSRGSYFRVELDSSYFRRKQLELSPSRLTEAQATAWQIPPPDPGLWRLFEEILAEFKKQKLNVIVNEIEEAPFSYPHPEVKLKYRAFMHDVVKLRVEQAGFRYVRIDFDQLSDSDYFDYNHLNSIGSQKAAPMLARAIAPYLQH